MRGHPPDLGPPGRGDGEGGPSPRPADAQKLEDTSANQHGQDNAQRTKIPGGELVWVPCRWRRTEDLPGQLRNRRDAAKRSVPHDCTCRDTWTCRCYDRSELTERHVDAYRDAVLHLLDNGMMPAPDIQAMRVMWRRGGRERHIVSEIASSWEAA